MNVTQNLADEILASINSQPPPWDDPDPSLLSQAIPAPVVPKNVLPSWWQEWTREAAEGASAPHAYVVGALFSAIGAIIGNSRWASPWDSWKEPPVLNCALIGTPSSGKSPALDTIVECLNKLENEINSDFAERKRKKARLDAEFTERKKLWEDDVRRAAKTGAPAPSPPSDMIQPEPIQRKRLFSTDTTIEKAGHLSAANPRGLLLQRDELAGWLGSMDRYTGSSGGDRAFWLQAYGGRPWSPDRVKDGDDPIQIPHLLWAILGTIQPETISAMLLNGLDDGLSARFLFFWPDSSPPTRPTRVADRDSAYQRLKRLYDLPWPEKPDPKIIAFSEAAAEHMQKWRKQVYDLEQSVSGKLVSWVGKLPGFALRLSLILEFLIWTETSPDTPEPSEISERAILAALTFLEDFALPMAQRTFGVAALSEAERDAKRVARWLVRQKPIPKIINARDLRNQGGGPGIRDAKPMEAALAELVKAGWLRHTPSRAGGYGQPRKDFEVNPAIANLIQ